MNTTATTASAAEIDNIVSKIQKLMNLADPSKGATPAEMEAAILAAQKLAAKHSLSLGSIADEAAKRTGTAPATMETVSTTISPKRTTEGAHHKFILRALRDCFGIRYIFIPEWDHDRIGFVGTPADVAIATYCFEWLERAFPSSYCQWRKSVGRPKIKAERENYYSGLGQGIVETNKRVTEDMTKADSDRYALVLVDKNAVVAARYQAEFPNAHTRQSRGVALNRGVYSAGLANGRAMKLATGAIAG